MSSIRWIGLVAGVCVFLFIFNRFRHGRVKRSDFCWGILFSVGLIIVSANPNSVNVLRDMLSLRETQFSRLISISIVSNILLWLLLIYTRFRWTNHSEQFDRLVRSMGLSEFKANYPQIESLPSIVVIIPAYNEQGNIGMVLEGRPKKVLEKDLAFIVIDDGSQDNTFGVARDAGALAVHSPIHRGGGGALRIGFDIAEQYGADVVVTMDADGQHLPSEIERLVKPILSGDVDFVIGSRILGKREKDSMLRYIGIHVFNFVVRLLTPVKVSDCSSGFRAFRLSELGRVLLRQDQFHTSELIIEAAKKGIRIGEVPITVKRRLSGKSKKGKSWTYALNFARTIIKTWWR